MSTKLAAFGIEGLDDILRGGLPRGRTYLVKGRPGVGKTTLALQFLLAGAKLGERVLYITLSETTEELQTVAQSHGWSLGDLTLFELKAAEAQRLTEEQYTMYQPSEIELGEVVRTLLDEVDRVKPERVVFDSLSEIRLLSHEPLRYRRQVLALKQRFAGSGCTVLLLDDQGGESSDEHLESLVHGVVSLERRSPVYGPARRRLEISKLRGVSYRDGFHDYVITSGGICVFPRLIAAEHRHAYESGQIPSGVKAFDDLVGGGLDRGTATLVLGPAGSGKSTIAMQYAVTAASRGEPSAVMTFDENLDTAFARAAALSLPLKRYVDAGLVRLQQVDPAELSPGQFAHAVRLAVEQGGARAIVIDSLTGYLNAMPGENFLLVQLHELLAYLGQQGVVTLLIATQHGLIGSTTESSVDASYLADTVILLRYYEARGEVRKAVSLLKRRMGAHERTIRDFALGPGGIRVGKPLKDFHGVLTGVPSFSGEPESLLEAEDAGGS